MISQTAEYALRAVVFLAEQNGRSSTIQEIAANTKVLPGYLAKVMQGLARSGVLDSQRGKTGGYTLAKPADELTVYEVVQAVDPIARIVSCPLEREGHSEALCGLHRQLDEAAAELEKRFRACRVTDLLDTALVVAS